jgi:hypothetical protein
VLSRLWFVKAALCRKLRAACVVMRVSSAANGPGLDASALFLWKGKLRGGDRRPPQRSEQRGRHGETTHFPRDGRRKRSVDTWRGFRA